MRATCSHCSSGAYDVPNGCPISGEVLEGEIGTVFYRGWSMTIPSGTFLIEKYPRIECTTRVDVGWSLGGFAEL